MQRSIFLNIETSNLTIYVGTFGKALQFLGFFRCSHANRAVVGAKEAFRGISLCHQRLVNLLVALSEVVQQELQWQALTNLTNSLVALSEVVQQELHRQVLNNLQAGGTV